MTNTNCLENIKCPACGNEESFRIAAKTIVTVTDVGTEDHSDMEWDDDSYAECTQCLRYGALEDFTVPNVLEADERGIAVTGTEHTSAPWRITMESVVTRLFGSDDKLIAELRLAGDKKKANARLIAAAPAQALMLDLVRYGLLSLADGDAEFNGTVYAFDHMQPDWGALIDAIGWDTARDAIAKATTAA